MWKCEVQYWEYMMVTAHWVVKNHTKNTFKIKNDLLEVAEFFYSTHAYSVQHKKVGKQQKTIQYAVY